MKNFTTKIVSGKGTEYSLAKPAVAMINSKNCVNCGECRKSCPVEAISEQQRVICRVCPECTSRPTLTLNEMYSLATAKACTTACPLGTSPQGYINLAKAGKFEKAYQLVWETNPLPSVCARICHHPCEQACKRGILVDEPIAIRSIKRFLSEKVKWNPEPYPSIYEEHVAIIGSGPAGLTAAHYLAQMGYKVTVFDSATEAGGMLRRGIPEFRLPRDVVSREIEHLEEAGIEFKLSTKINKVDLEKLKNEYDGIIIATGAPNSKELNIEGRRMEGVMTALNFMERINNGQDIWRHPGQTFNLDGEVVVIGGGSVAIDTARTALRIGAKRVTVICLECGEEVPCHSWELDEAREEGVIIMEGYSPQRFVGSHPKLEGVEVCRVISCKKDQDGKISVEIDNNDKRIVPADWAIVAIGQAHDAIWNAANDEYIAFAGDVKSQACSVVDAMASGKKAAGQIDAFLRERVLKDPLSLRTLNEASPIEKIYPATRLKTKRPEIPMLSKEYRVNSFEEVEGCLDDIAASEEVLRCLGCGYQEVDSDKCIGCGVCQKICPKGDVITMIAVLGGGVK